MKKITILKNNFKKILISFFIFLFLINGFYFSTRHAFAVAATDEAVQNINDIGNNGEGLIPDCGRTGDSATEEVCSPKDAVLLIKDLGQVFVYIVIIALVLMLVIGGVGYVFYGKNPTYLVKVKKYITNSVVALLIIMGVFLVIFGLLETLGFNSDLLNFLKGIFAFNDFSLIPHAMAQDIPKLGTGGGSYINFFPEQTLGSLVLLTIKFLINYIAGPVLVIAVMMAGFKFVKAEGNPKELGEAKKFAERVIIAIVVAAAAQMVVMILLNTVKDIQTQTGSNNNASSQDLAQQENIESKPLTGSQDKAVTEVVNPIKAPDKYAFLGGQWSKDGGKMPYPAGDWSNTKPELQTALNNFQKAWVAKGHQKMTVNQVYRPADYAKHIRYLWEYDALYFHLYANSRDPKQDPYGCDAINFKHLTQQDVTDLKSNDLALEEVKYEISIPGVRNGKAPACSSDHGIGIAFDISSGIPTDSATAKDWINTAISVGLCHNQINDPGHFALTKYLPANTNCRQSWSGISL